MKCSQCECKNGPCFSCGCGECDKSKKCCVCNAEPCECD